MDVFAPYFKINGCFIVKNISPQIKTINIFNYPINYKCQRDLLQIPGVAENDIRASLLKGELQHKILSQDIIIICSDIDLLQFNSSQKSFLTNAGIVNGISVNSSNMEYLDNQDIILIGNINGSNRIFTLPNNDYFIQSSPYKIIVYWNGVKQALNDDYFISESGGPGTGYNTVTMTIPPTSGDIITADYYTINY